MRKVVMAWAAMSLCGGAAWGAVVVNPFPAIQPGISARIKHFTTIPGTQAGRPQTGVQQLKPVGDKSGRLFVNDTRGILYVTNKAGATPKPYLDLRAQNIGFSNAANSTQTGLMSFAFHPNFNQDPSQPGYRTAYTIDTTAASAGTATWSLPGQPVSHHDVVREWTVADPAASVATVTGMREVMRLSQPRSDHGPGTIAFNSSAKPGSADYGKLYVGLGDGGGVNDPSRNAQNLQSPFGKILRIDPADPDGAGPLSYGVPTDNPFAGQAGARGEVWAYGLRNPQHFSWSADGRMFIGEIGQAQIEEVDLGKAGSNYGWPIREGSYARGTGSDQKIYDTPANPGMFVDPIAQYDHEEIVRDGISSLASLGSAFLYEGSLVPELVGKLLVSDLVSGRLFYLDPNDPRAMFRELTLTLDGLPTTMRALEGYATAKRVDLRLGVDDRGEIYLLSKGNGDIYRLMQAVPEPETWAMALAGFGLLGWRLRRQRRLCRA
ncbi:PQQ-dependent sugar dehydrogenase [uncultured Sphingomonas sp.]|uniref:PQQ-dependent sugar dehydrogenase n=1 Tax=uncultured Sphingomonas sp. TaxID=158754 RepID=UPI0025D14637|nr:PQQ-dependent sugar dehydrogenase [uncultured Sphingomonas sp.]